MGPIPREFAAVMRPELPSLLEEMAAEIVAAIPEYGPLLEGPNGRVIKIGIEQSIATFVDRVAAPTATTALRDDLCRQFGRFEAYEGRSLDSLQSAYRIGCQVALRRVRTVGRRYSLSASFMLTFADALFAYMGDLAELSREGYVQALEELGEEPDNRRRRLLRRILGGAAVARGALAELADHSGWPLPEEVTLVALAPGSRPSRAALDRDLLVDFADPEPHLLIPGPLTPARRESLAAALDGCRAAVGLTTALGEAADSLRWARHTLALAESGIISPAGGANGTGGANGMGGANGTGGTATGAATEARTTAMTEAGTGAASADGGGVLLSEDHLLPLWLLGDSALADQIATKYLAPLVGLTPAQRSRLIDTLRIRLTTRGTAAQVAELLGVHPQTVRYRLRILDRAFGDQLADPDDRFATEIALRALHLREHGEGGGARTSPPRGPAPATAAPERAGARASRAVRRRPPPPGPLRGVRLQLGEPTGLARVPGERQPQVAGARRP
ncbi:helix-turn-helix domain-containing protein [Actinacidiphila sp. DG2A-62]|uniref:PucR family transcriptional regulator n=1 Tax=Actinacidiphila sp. DG2A-62 TaxID=3108821 RepID=UPI002DBE6223|nr:helix-turn-helix domain-containing protein [Actinacidiphila sp. DG2A-62]MEC3993682.1 helix-turn-helix domain-containing protein [Actinacidiphila sp. DG2A-62]